MDGIWILRGNPVGGYGDSFNPGIEVFDAIWRSILMRRIYMDYFKSPSQLLKDDYRGGFCFCTSIECLE